MGTRLRGIIVLVVGTFCAACASNGTGTSVFATDESVNDAASSGDDGDDGSNNDSGGGSSTGTSTGTPASTGVDDTSGDDAASADEPASPGDDSGVLSAPDGSSCFAPTCMACVTGQPCCTAAGACGCPFLSVCL
jgi:hypothetical protein